MAGMVSTPHIVDSCGKTYILPVLLYGCELWMLQPKEVERLEIFQRSKLRQLQNLPDCTPKMAVLGLMGILPVCAEIDIKIFTLLRSCLADKTNVEHKIAMRQLALKGLKSKSWFVYVNKKLEEYCLPSAHDLLQNTPRKLAWHKLVKTKVIRFWEDAYLKETKKLNSTRHMSTSTLCFTSVAPTWSSCAHSMRETEKARIKVRALCGVMALQARTSRQNNQSPMCKMCGSGPETREHFLLKCPTTEEIRAKYVREFHTALAKGGLTYPAHDPELQIQIILDPHHETLTQTLKENCDLQRLETIGRNMVYWITQKRLEFLNTVGAGRAVIDIKTTDIVTWNLQGASSKRGNIH